MNTLRHLIAILVFFVIVAGVTGRAHMRGTAFVGLSNADSPPVAVDDGPINVHGPTFRLDQIIFANDTGAQPLSLNVIGQNPSHGQLTFGDGTQIFYRVSGYIGPDSFTYSVHDINGPILPPSL